VRIVVLGAGGLLGRHVVAELSRDGRHAVTALVRAQCDVGDTAAVQAAAAGAQLIINCAGYTNVDGAETHEDEAYRSNVLGADNVARAANINASTYVHVSTDFVFDGAQREPYDEFDRPNPRSIYARSKWAGEELVQKRGGKWFIARVQGLYGRGGANFSSKLRQLVRDGKPLKLDGERRVQPTWARAAARQILALAASDHYGLYHVSCKGETTWAGFTERLAQKLGVEKRWQVVRSDELQAPAARPPNCLFRHRLLALRGLDVMPDWESAQDEYLKEEEQA
jgi:dTDP-4-dehydrorhamnose reductase